jgi:hypothetical protein
MYRDIGIGAFTIKRFLLISWGRFLDILVCGITRDFGNEGNKPFPGFPFLFF